MKKFFEKLKSVKFSTILRTVLQVLVYANQAVASLSGAPFASQLWYQILSYSLTVLITIITYWYNNDWTKLAIACGDIFDMVRDGKITNEELEAFIDKHKENE